ncbi:hypothetical protein BJX66DRAFT_345203 [Aspergillus keveii]|uniref:C6 transcription factor n=1 Tax=Aspergillus keveii TaxID=714993 RepID=A0ABR4FIU2_9EURO
MIGADPGERDLIVNPSVNSGIKIQEFEGELHGHDAFRAQNQQSFLTLFKKWLFIELAQAHHALSNTWVEHKSSNTLPPSKRLDCLASIRQQLRHDGDNPEPLSRLLVAVLLIYFLDGYIDCSEESASTGSHQAGVQAIAESLGGFHALVDKCQEETSMLLSEFASSNLTRSLLDNYLPCFPADI